MTEIAGTEGFDYQAQKLHYLLKEIEERFKLLNCWTEVTVTYNKKGKILGWGKKESRWCLFCQNSSDAFSTTPLLSVSLSVKCEAAEYIGALYLKCKAEGKELLGKIVNTNKFLEESLKTLEKE